jgi:creatinine amidohydrolase
VPIDSPLSHLVALPDAALWTSRAWTDFAHLRSPAKNVVVLPLFGSADWGLGRSLDLEEMLGTAVLRTALMEPAARKLSLLVLPPLRWVLGPYPHSVFAVDYETAHELLREVAASVHAAGFRKLVLFNSSPWNEELVDAAGRDVRVALGLHTFCINLSALDLDLHPVRAATRVGVQCAACACYDALPVDEATNAEITWPDFRPGNVRQPGAVALDRSLDQARRDGGRIVDAAGRKLAALLGEIYSRRSLPRDGPIPKLRLPGTTHRTKKTRRRNS